jgi:hypothetical protein
MKRFLTVLVALVLALGVFEWYNNYRTKKFVAAAHVAEGLALAVSIKNQIAYFYSETGKLPSSNQEIGLPEAEQFVGQSLTSLAVSDGGAITLTFNELSGVKDGIIRLVPDASNPAMVVQWQCVTPNYKNIGGWAPQCKYVP